MTLPESAPASAEETKSEPAESESAPLLPPRKRKVVSWLILLALVGVVLSLGPHWPKDRSVDFRFDTDASSIVRLDVTWTRVDSGDASEPATGTTFRFEPGQAPKIVHTDVHLPDGSYALDITLERADHVETVQRTLTLGDTDRITIPLR